MFERVRNQKLVVRFLFAFIIVLITFFTLILLVFNSSSEIAELTDTIIEHPLAVSNAAYKANVLLLSVHRDMKDLILEENELKLINIYQGILAKDILLRENLDLAYKQVLGDEGKALVLETINMYENWKPIRQEVIEYALENDYEMSRDFSLGKSKNYVTNLEIKFEDLNAYARSKANVLSTQIDENQVQLTQILIIITIAFVIIFGLTMFFVARGIIVKVRELKSKMIKATKEEVFEEAIVKGNDEITELATAYNIMTKGLSESIWLKDAQNDLRKLVLNIADEKDYMPVVIKYIVGKTDSISGAYYRYYNNNEELVLDQTYNLTVREEFVNKIKFGDGIIGQCAKEREMIIIKNVSKGQALIESASISRAPSSLLAIPILKDGKLFGVFEFTSLDEYNKIHVEFINEVVESISFDLNEKINLTKIKELLHLAEESNKETLRSYDEIQNMNVELEERQQMLETQTVQLNMSNAELEEQQAKLEASELELREKNLAAMHLSQQLDKKNKELLQSNKYQGEFLTNMSHELRTPLNSIILLSNLLSKNKDRNLGEDDIKKAAVINKAGNELLKLINNLLDLSKIEQGLVEIHNSEFKSSSFLSNLNGLFVDLANLKEIEFNITDNANVIFVTDEDKLRQIVINLLSNSFKFTSKGHVNLSVNKTYDANYPIEIIVADTGIGIPKDKIGVIFESFKQVDGSISRNYGGTGLGLSITKNLSNALDIKIEVDSDHGSGSIFKLKMPKVSVAKKSDKLENIQNEQANTEISNSKINVLLIEDDDVFIESILSELDNAIYNVEVAKNGKDGINLAKLNKYSGIMLDLGLPDMDGIEVLNILKSDITTKDIPVQIISAADLDQMKYIELGADGVNLKTPEVFNDINDIVSKFVNLSGSINKKILIVEDRSEESEFLDSLISTSQNQVYHASSIEDAKEMLSKQDFDLVIQDLNLPDGSGLEVCKYAKERNPKLPVIVFTAKELLKEESRKLYEYSDSIILKTPYSHGRLLDEIMMFLHRVELESDIISSNEFQISLIGKKVLVVDDDVKNVFSLSSALEEKGAIIVEAFSGNEALTNIDNTFDLVLMDIMMPHMDGIEAIKSIRKKAAYDNIPIIAITAKTLKKDREEVLAAGANEFLSKPVDFDLLYKIIEKCLTTG